MAFASRIYASAYPQRQTGLVVLNDDNASSHQADQTAGRNQSNSPMSKRQLVHAALIVDGVGRQFEPGAIILEGQHIIATGTPAHIGRCGDVCARNFQQFVVMPALVNAHAHLDLTLLSPQPNRGDFTDWIRTIRGQRATDGQAIHAAVQKGAELSRAGGVAMIGDIAGIGSLHAVEALRESELEGVSYLEVFGMGTRQPDAIKSMQDALVTIDHNRDGVRLGIQPHAPYSCGIDVYRAAAATGLPIATHLAETLHELQFVRDAAGPFRTLLEEFGVWDDSITGSGRHPIDHLTEICATTPMTLAHVNYIEDAHLEILAKWPASVVYCPRASAYFGHPHENRPGHRYQEMLTAGINVALGTDSIVCLDTPQRISTLDEMRFLYKRDGMNPELLLRMATVNGAHALQMDSDQVTLNNGPTAGLIAVAIDPASKKKPLQQVCSNNEVPVWIE